MFVTASGGCGEQSLPSILGDVVGKAPQNWACRSCDYNHKGLGLLFNHREGFPSRESFKFHTFFNLAWPSQGTSLWSHPSPMGQLTALLDNTHYLFALVDIHRLLLFFVVVFVCFVLLLIFTVHFSYTRLFAIVQVSLLFKKIYLADHYSVQT